MIVTMDDQRIGAALRVLRINKRWRQADLAARTGVPRETIGRIEHGRIANVRLVTLRRLADALGARLDSRVRSLGGDVDRMLNQRHSAMHEAFARMIRGVAGWELVPEVSFSIYGERGVIDVLLWHPVARVLVIVELKTELVDLNELMTSMDRRERLARRIALDRGWDPVTVSVWVVVAEGRTSRRRVATHRTVLRSRFPAGGRAMAAWLRRPSGRIAALSFMSIGEGRVRTNRRVRITRERDAVA